MLLSCCLSHTAGPRTTREGTPRHFRPAPSQSWQPGGILQAAFSQPRCPETGFSKGSTLPSSHRCPQSSGRTLHWGPLLCRLLSSCTTQPLPGHREICVRGIATHTFPRGQGSATFLMNLLRLAALQLSCSSLPWNVGGRKKKQPSWMYFRGRWTQLYE